MSQNLQDLFDNTHSSSFKKHSEETRARMSAAHKGKMSEEHKDAIRKTHTGKVISESQRKAISAANTNRVSVLKGVPGRKWTDEQKLAHAIRQQLEHEAGLRKTTKGTKMSDEARAKMSEAARNRKGPSSNAKRIHTPFGEFDSALIACEKLNVAYCTIGRRMKKDPSNYYYL